MKKSIIDNIYNIIKNGVNQGIGHLYTEDSSFNGTTITLRNRAHINFGSYSYLNLELDERLKNGAIKAIQNYGIQYPSSRTYVSSGLYKELEELLFKIYEYPVVLCTTTTLAHIAAMPIVLEEGDAIIVDQQVHTSVQFMVLNMKQQGIPFQVLRHNNIEQLELKIKELSKTFNRIWYMCDSVYSMYGDIAPMKQINELLNKYKKFYLYADDAHGMSWTGKNGRGYVLDYINCTKKVVVISSLNKAFAAGGAVIVVSDPNLSNKIRSCGSPLIFAGQHQMSALGASIESAKIHLSEEISLMQKSLMNKIKYCHKLLIQEELPVISDGVTPIFFIGVGLPKVGYNLVKKMMDSGFYVNLAVFPAVPEACTGIRFSITVGHSEEEICNLVKQMKINFDEALKEEERTIYDIHKAFRKIKKFNLVQNQVEIKRKNQYTILHVNSISKINQVLWDSLLGSNSTFDWMGLIELEKTFRNQEEHNNWGFHYFIVKNESGIPVFASYATECLTKDDIISPASVSYKIEIERLQNPYYLCSKTLTLGCPLSIGKHHYYSEVDTNWKTAFSFLLDYLGKILDDSDITNLNLRDFDSKNQKIIDFMRDEGYIKIDMPANYVIKDLVSRVDYLQKLNSSQRYFVKKRALRNEEKFLVEIINNEDHPLIDEIYNLYLNVKERSYELNLFDYPKNLFTKATINEQWDLLVLKLKEDSNKPVAIALSYINTNTYHFKLCGLDYNYIKEYDIYNQLIWQIIARAIQLQCDRVDLGITTGQNKRKFGAVNVNTCSFVQLKDNYNASIINNMSQENVHLRLIKNRRKYSNLE